MSRLSWFGGAAAALALACPAGVLAQQQQQTQPSAQAQAAQPASFTDAQLRAFAAASTEINPISQSLANANAEQRAQASTRIRAILERNNLDADTYNAIASRAQSDAALAARINALKAPSSGGTQQ
jgi:hypothetical protein